MAIHLSEEEFSGLVEQAMDLLPEQFEPYLENVSVEIHPRPSRQFMRTHEIAGSPGNLLGLYHGVPQTSKSVSSPYELPPQIFIFQRNIESICNTREDVIEQVRQTVLHEIGHHLGMEEDDLDELGY